MVTNPTAIDLSRLPAPNAIENYGAEAAVEDWLTDFDTVTEGKFTGLNEGDPAVKVLEAGALRETVVRARVNDGIRAILPAFARDSDLDHIVAKANIERIILYAEDGVTVTFRENDTRLLQRYLLSFEAPAAGSEGGYLARALKAYPEAQDIMAFGPAQHGRRGRTEIVLLAKGGQPVPREAISAVVAALRGERDAPLTDEVVVRAGRVQLYRIAYHLIVPEGPNKDLVKAVAVQAATAFAAERYRLGGEVPAAGALATGYIPNVLRVVPGEPMADISPRYDAAPYCTGIDITAEVAK